MAGPSRVVGWVVGAGDLDGRGRRVNQHRARGDTCGRIRWRDVASGRRTCLGAGFGGVRRRADGPRGWPDAAATVRARLATERP